MNNKVNNKLNLKLFQLENHLEMQLKLSTSNHKSKQFKILKMMNKDNLKHVFKVFPSMHMIQILELCSKNVEQFLMLIYWQDLMENQRVLPLLSSTENLL